jgi:hypothetical protein
MQLLGKAGSSEREQSASAHRQNVMMFNNMVSFTVSPRNMLSPQIRKFGNIYSLPDAPHRLYFTRRGAELSSLISSQIAAPRPIDPQSHASRLIGTSGPAERALRDLGYIGALGDELADFTSDVVPNEEHKCSSCDHLYPILDPLSPIPPCPSCGDEQ